MALLDVQGNPVRRLIMQTVPTERKRAAQAIGASAIKGGNFSYPPDELVVQSLMYSFSRHFCKYWEPKHDAVKFLSRRSSVQWRN